MLIFIFYLLSTRGVVRPLSRTVFELRLPFQKHSKELLCTAILRPMTNILDAAESAFITIPDSIKEYPEQIDSNRDLEPPRKDPTIPLKHIVNKLETKKSKLPNFGVTIFPTPLQWIEAVKDGEVCAEILCSAELIQVY